MDIMPKDYPLQMFMPVRDVPFSEKRWKRVLKLLKCQEIECPYGVFTIYSDRNVATLQYKTEFEKERIYYYLVGVWHQKIFDVIDALL